MLTFAELCSRIPESKRVVISPAEPYDYHIQHPIKSLLVTILCRMANMNEFTFHEGVVLRLMIMNPDAMFSFKEMKTAKGTELIFEILEHVKQVLLI